MKNKLIRKAGTAVLALSLSISGIAAPCSLPPIVQAESISHQMESLDRGLIAFQSGNGIFLSWRLLGTEVYETTFHVYKNGTYLADVTDSTNYYDASGSTNDTYSVRSVVNGTERTESDSVKPWGQNYLDVPIDKPGDIYSANDASVADVDGDGEYEIILKWDPSDSQDNSKAGKTSDVYMDCYKMNGTKLWRINLGKNIRAGAHYTQFIAYDFDGDGKAEVAMKTADGTVAGDGQVIGDASKDYRNSSGYILEGPEYLTMFEGATGKILDTIDYVPARGNVSDWGDSYGNRVDRFLAGLAYLDGKTPSLIECRGYYTRTVVSAFKFENGKFRRQWTFDTNSSTNKGKGFDGQGNHSLAIADVDEDGFDEIVYGSMVIDHNGYGLYTTKQGHGDAMHVGDFEPSNPGLEVFQVHETKSTDIEGVQMRDAKTGKTLWHDNPGTDVGRGLVANIGPDYAPYVAIASTGIYDSNGNKLDLNLGKFGVNFTIYWDGDLYQEGLDRNYINKYNYNTKGIDRLLTADNVHSNNSTKATPSLCGDIFGDWREEVMWPTADDSALRIYSTGDVTNHKLYTLMSDLQYREAIAWQNVGYNQPPHPSYYISEDMPTPTQPSMYTVGTYAEKAVYSDEPTTQTPQPDTQATTVQPDTQTEQPDTQATTQTQRPDTQVTTQTQQPDTQATTQTQQPDTQATTQVQQPISVAEGTLQTEGTLETLSAIWNDTNAANAVVSYKSDDADSYTTLTDTALIRQVTDKTARVDIPGLAAGHYTLLIRDSSGHYYKKSGISVASYDRSGYAHFNYDSGVGAYKDSGELKENAIVLYVTNENKDTITVPGYEQYGTGIGNILNAHGNSQPFFIKLAEDGKALAIRFIGEVTAPEGLTAYNSTENGGATGDNGNMALIRNAKNITIEGIGSDACINGWGFSFIVGIGYENHESYEVRNLTFKNYTEDALGFQGTQSNDQLTDPIERVWVHNNTFYKGHCDNPAESDKADGDGSCDFKRGQYFTLSCNYFEDCHKTDLIGAGGKNLQYHITMHHNYYNKCGARMPLVRQADVHSYNNYFVGAASSVISARASAYVFSEANYYENCKNPVETKEESTINGSLAGVVKSYNDIFENCTKTNAATVVDSRDQKIDNTCLYSDFDTNAQTFYYDSVNNVTNAYITDAVAARTQCIIESGTLKDNFISSPSEDITNSETPVSSEQPATQIATEHNTSVLPTTEQSGNSGNKTTHEQTTGNDRQTNEQTTGDDRQTNEQTTGDDRQTNEQTTGDEHRTNGQTGTERRSTERATSNTTTQSDSSTERTIPATSDHTERTNTSDNNTERTTATQPDNTATNLSTAERTTRQTGSENTKSTTSCTTTNASTDNAARTTKADGTSYNDTERTTKQATDSDGAERTTTKTTAASGRSTQRTTTESTDYDYTTQDSDNRTEESDNNRYTDNNRTTADRTDSHTTTAADNRNITTQNIATQNTTRQAATTQNTTRQAATTQTLKTTQKTTTTAARTTSITAPKKSKVLKIKQSGRKATISIKKVTNATGYQIQISKNRIFKQKKSVSGKKTTYKVKLSTGTYYIRVRAYITNNNQKVYGKWSAIRKLKKR